MSFMQRSAGASFNFGRGGLTRFGLLAVFGLLAGCQGEVTMDLGTELPTDPALNQIVANVRGLQFVTSSGGTKTLEFRDSEQLDFINLANDNGVLRLFTDEQLSDGNYTGVRLLFDEDRADDAFVTNNAGTEFPLNIATVDYSPIGFNIENNQSSKDSFTLVLDLRKTLSFDNGDNEYTLTPTLRTVKTEDMSRIEGNVTVTCPVGNLSTGAIYLYQGEDVTPDDVGGSGTQPFATAPIFTGTGGIFFYALRYLPAGNYTLALTCNGNDEDVLEDQDLQFRNIQNVRVDDSETVTRDLP